MKKSGLLATLFCILALFGCSGKSQGGSDNEDPDASSDSTVRTFYISSSDGSDSNSGISQKSPWKSLGKINNETFKPGDRILLKSGDVWNGCTKIASRLSGNSEKPIVISSYGSGEKPVLTSTTGQGSDAVLTISSCEYVMIENLDIRNCPGYGLIVGDNNITSSRNVTVRNVHTSDMPNVGIFFSNTNNEDIQIISCTSERTMNLFAVSGGKNINLKDCKAQYCGYGGYSIIGVEGGRMENCSSFYGGQNDAPQGTCGLFLGIVDGYEVSNCEFAFQQRHGTDPDGEAIDFERNNSNVIIDSCYLHDNAGCAIMFYDSGGGDIMRNDHCSITNCRIENNHRNALSPRGAEIYFSNLEDNNYGLIANNSFVLPEGVTFVTTADSTVTIENNKTKDGELLTVTPEYSGTPVIRNSSFESPALEAGTFDHRPVGGIWTFRGNSGITIYGSDFNPAPAPDGSQVLFLQGASDASQWISLPKGTYKLACMASYRQSSGTGQDFAFYVDGKKVSDSFQPTDATAYTNYESSAFSVEEGIRLIELKSSINEDKTVFIDNIQISSVQ